MVSIWRSCLERPPRILASEMLPFASILTSSGPFSVVEIVLKDLTMLEANLQVLDLSSNQFSCAMDLSLFVFWPNTFPSSLPRWPTSNSKGTSSAALWTLPTSPPTCRAFISPPTFSTARWTSPSSLLA